MHGGNGLHAVSPLSVSRTAATPMFDVDEDDNEDIDDMLQANHEDFYDDLFDPQEEEMRQQAPNHRTTDQHQFDAEISSDMSQENNEEHERDSHDEQEDFYEQELDDPSQDSAATFRSQAQPAQSMRVVSVRTGVDTPNPPLNPSSRPQGRVREANGNKTGGTDDIPSMEDVDWDTFPWSSLQKKTSEAQLALFSRIIGKKRLMEMFIEDLGLPPTEPEVTATELLKIMVSTYSEEHNVTTLITALQLIVQKGLNFDGFPRCADNFVDLMSESNQYKNQQLQESIEDYTQLTKQLNTNRGLTDAQRRSYQEQRLKLLEDVPLWMRKVIVGQKPAPQLRAQNVQTLGAPVFTLQQSQPKNSTTSSLPATVSSSSSSTNCSNPMLLAESSRLIQDLSSRVQERVLLSTDKLRQLNEFEVARAAALAHHLCREIDRVLNSKAPDPSLLSELAATCPSVIRTTLLSKK